MIILETLKLLTHSENCRSCLKIKRSTEITDKLWESLKSLTYESTKVTDKYENHRSHWQNMRITEAINKLWEYRSHWQIWESRQSLWEAQKSVVASEVKPFLSSEKCLQARTRKSQCMRHKNGFTEDASRLLSFTPTQFIVQSKLSKLQARGM